MTTKQTTPATDDGIPAALRRSPDEPGQIAPGHKATNGVTVATPSAPAPAAPKAAKAKATPAPKAAKAKTPRKGKVVDAAHKPSEVTATEANPQKSIVPVRFKTRYAETGDTCGDRVALALKAATTTKNADGRPAVDVAALKAVAEQNGIDWSAYAKMNVGQQRMNVGNRLRGMLKNEKPVTIGKQRFADWDKAKLVDKSAWAKPEPKAKAKEQATA